LKVDVDNLVSVEDKQKQVLAQMESKLLKGKDKISWKTKPLALFDDKNKYAKVSHSSDKRGLKIELSRLPVDVYDDIIRFVSEKVQDK
ncbi:ParB family protein, partial [Vibrio sp. 10N.261.45.F1]